MKANKILKYVNNSGILYHDAKYQSSAIWLSVIQQMTFVIVGSPVSDVRLFKSLLFFANIECVYDKFRSRQKVDRSARKVSNSAITFLIFWLWIGEDFL